jgi:hypothetical protein
MTFSTVQIGRLVLTELPKNPASEALSALTMANSGRLLHVSGQEFLQAAGLPKMLALQDDLEGMVKTPAPIPVVFGDKTSRNGYYLPYGASNSEANWNGETIINDWSVDLQRIGADTEVDFESRVSGAQTVNNSFTLTGVLWNAPPVGHYGFWSGTVAPPAVTRTGPDGALTVWTGLPLQNTYRWGCAVANYSLGRARVLNNSIERAGITFSPTQGLWELQNSLVRVRPLSSGGVIEVASYSGGAWQAKAWDITAAGTSLGVVDSATVLWNDYEGATVRLLKDTNPGRILVDLTLRRGSRFVEVYIQAEVAATLKIVRASAEGGSSATGTVTATSNDTAGNKYSIGSAHTFTADTTNGGISVATATTMDAYIGCVIGGTGAATGDAATDLLAQYAGRRSEYVQAVRR